MLSRKFGDKKYKEAETLEQQKKYKDACYAYAVAILNGSFTKKECRQRIKFLWEQHGPFDYRDIELQIKKEGDSSCDTAGHAVTMSIIEEVTTGKK